MIVLPLLLPRSTLPLSHSTTLATTLYSPTLPLYHAPYVPLYHSTTLYSANSQPLNHSTPLPLHHSNPIVLPREKPPQLPTSGHFAAPILPDLKPYPAACHAIPHLPAPKPALWGRNPDAQLPDHYRAS